MLKKNKKPYIKLIFEWDFIYFLVKEKVFFSMVDLKSFYLSNLERNEKFGFFEYSRIFSYLFFHRFGFVSAGVFKIKSKYDK